MKRTNIYLDEKQAAALDHLAGQEGVSRAELIRRLLDRALTSADENLASDLRAIETSFGVLNASDELARTPGAREAHIDSLWRRSS